MHEGAGGDDIYWLVSGDEAEWLQAAELYIRYKEVVWGDKECGIKVYSQG